MVGIFYAKIERGGMPVDEKEVFEICNQVDSFIAEYLTESIVKGTSYDMLEAHHGILLTSRTQFYREKAEGKKYFREKVWTDRGRTERTVEDGVVNTKIIVSVDFYKWSDIIRKN